MTFLFLAGTGCAAARPSPPGAPRVGEVIEVAAPDLQGRVQRLSDRAGQVRIVDFWATWCEPCRDQFPILARLARDHQAEGLAIYAISVDEELAQLTSFLEITPLPFTVLWDRGGARQADRLGVEKLPTTLLLDRAGRIRAVHQGIAGEAAGRLELEVDRLLREPR